ncbi:MAG: nucleoside triphosphate pyrophosphohydrolase [Acidobacteriaceae bacterium]|nr:nucleoside triphosphate pyrophosphohydrolase [Acidobacteriaceae bacterium]
MGSAATSSAGPLAEAISIMARLRAPGGCPWDREQSFDSIKRHTLEETYEVFDAIERRAWPELKDELGDLLLQVLFYAQMAAEEGYFDIGDVAANLNVKLVRRHPHVFPVDGKLADATDANAVLRNWERIKREEKQAAGAGADSQQVATSESDAATESAAASELDSIARSMPAVMEAGKLGSKASKVGFDWPDAEGLFAKLQEEIGELKAELVEPDRNQERVEEEFGDLMFTAVNLARHLKVDAEMALRGANAKFRRRFGAIEKAAGGFEALASLSPEELDGLWNRAKASPGG